MIYQVVSKISNLLWEGSTKWLGRGRGNSSEMMLRVRHLCRINSLNTLRSNRMRRRQQLSKSANIKQSCTTSRIENVICTQTLWLKVSLTQLKYLGCGPAAPGFSFGLWWVWSQRCIFNLAKGIACYKVCWFFPLADEF